MGTLLVKTKGFTARRLNWYSDLSIKQIAALELAQSNCFLNGGIHNSNVDKTGLGNGY